MEIPRDIPSVVSAKVKNIGTEPIVMVSSAIFKFKRSRKWVIQPEEIAYVPKHIFAIFLRGRKDVEVIKASTTLTQEVRELNELERKAKELESINNNKKSKKDKVDEDGI